MSSDNIKKSRYKKCTQWLEQGREKPHSPAYTSMRGEDENMQEERKNEKEGGPNMKCVLTGKSGRTVWTKHSVSCHHEPNVSRPALPLR